MQVESENIQHDSLSNRILILFITLCSVSFFLIKGLGKGARITDLVGIGAILFFLILNIVYNKESNSISKNFSIPIWLLLLSTLISAIACQQYYDQPVSITLYQQRELYYILFYFLLHYLKPSGAWVKEFIFYIAVSSAFFYIVQHVLYPVKITEAKMFIDRGTLRINLPGIVFQYLGFFLCIVSFFKTLKPKYAAGALILLVAAVLSAFRSTIGIYIMFAMLYMILSNRVKSKLMLTFLSLVIIASGFFAFQGIFQGINEQSKREKSQGSDYVRIKASEYFLKDTWKNPVMRITGNGRPHESSALGRKTFMVRLKYSYYLTDIGIVGSYYQFGVLFVLMTFFMMIQVLVLRIGPDLIYIKLFMAMQLLAIFIASPFVEDMSGLIAVSFVFYLIDCERHVLKTEQTGVSGIHPEMITN